MDERASSADGCSIAWTSSGEGPPLVLVGGGLDDGAENEPLMAELDDAFMVCNYARRGRGASGDTSPYAVEREIEDLAAVIASAGDRAHVFAASSGGALAVRAAAAGLPIDRLVLFDVPYVLGEFNAAWQQYRDDLDAALDRGDRPQALRLFMQLAGSPPELIAEVESSPYWSGMLALAHTLAYDAACLGDGLPPAKDLGRLDQPVLVLTSGSHDMGTGGLPVGFFDDAADAVSAALPNASRDRVVASGHTVRADLLAPVLRAFLG